MRAVGAEPLVLDTLDARAVREAVAAVRPDAIAYQATSLSDLSDFKHFDRSHELARAAEEAVAYEPPDQPAIT